MQIMFETIVFDQLITLQLIIDAFLLVVVKWTIKDLVKFYLHCALFGYQLLNLFVILSRKTHFYAFKT